MTSTTIGTTRATHPLEPRAWEILRTRQALDGRIRVVSITLRAGSHAG